jgi:phenylacetate-coenzyme A ligase PaaK-like adenylate-forming protein
MLNSFGYKPNFKAPFLSLYQMTLKEYKTKLFSIATDQEFNQLCLFAFRYQYENIKIYKQFVDALNTNPQNVKHYAEIPFLPISFFKSHKLCSGTPQCVFKSSGTTALTRSQHFVSDLNMYQASFLQAFKQFYGDIKSYRILALLPSYIQNGDSSLVFMADHLIKESKHKESGFYLDDKKELINNLNFLEQQKHKTLLLGVSYALLDLIESHQFQLKNTLVMETGGMKGRRKEMIREELHQHLSQGFGVKNIHSEYGMTELLSQAYSFGNGLFTSPSWMKVLIRDVNDPFQLMPEGQSGGINIIDLANIHSLSFIETKDLGKIYPSQDFEILGRFDDSDIRGCNLLIA